MWEVLYQSDLMKNSTDMLCLVSLLASQLVSHHRVLQHYICALAEHGSYRIIFNQLDSRGPGSELKMRCTFVLTYCHLCPWFWICAYLLTTSWSI